MKPSKEDEKFLVPQELKTTLQKHPYNPVIMQQIIYDIATTNLPIEKIIKKYKQSKPSVYWWRATNRQLLDAWMHAMRHRTLVMADEMSKDSEKVQSIVDDREEDPRYQSVQAQFFEKKCKVNQWFMAKHNREVYGDKVEVDSQVTINHVEARQRAWEHAQAIEAQYDVVDATRNKASHLQISVDNSDEA